MCNAVATAVRLWQAAPPRSEGRPIQDTVWSQEDLIDSRVGVHDHRQFEVKIDYSIDPTRRVNRYTIDAYFFVPASLGITPQTYGRDLFYTDMQAYIRFKTPPRAVDAILDKKAPQSPWGKIHRGMPEVERDPRNRRAVDAVDRDLRMLGCLLRANFRDRGVQCVRAIERGEAPADVALWARTLVRDMDRVRGALRTVRERFLAPTVPPRLRDAFLWVDEFFSDHAESVATNVVAAMDRSGPAPHGAARRHLTDAILAHRRHRQEAGYNSVLDPDRPGEHYVYRRGILKKFITSVLFLRLSKHRGRQWSQLVGGFSAGVAMLFSVVATLWGQQRFGIDSFPFVMTLVLAYVMKDRIKEGVKLVLGARLARWLVDYDTRIDDPAQDVGVGRCRETFGMLPEGRVPREVYDLRHADSSSATERRNKPETVLRYRKQISLWGKRIGRRHGPVCDVNDIIRFSVENLIKKADDPARDMKFFDPTQDVVREVRCPKVYHLNLVLALRADAGEQPASIERVRVILDQTGIRRMERP